MNGLEGNSEPENGRKGMNEGESFVRSAEAPQPTTDAVRSALSRILASPSFARSPRMTAMLRHVVEETLAGRQAYLREYNLGLEVFERSASFDPQTSPIVRVQASKLRRTLALYYADEGRDDPLRIDLPKGCYVPVWTAQQPAARSLRDSIDTPLSKPDAVAPTEPERRQLTVLRCQLMDSAELTEQLGVEEAFEVVQRYQAVANEVVQKYRGQLTHLGEGLVAYFGYPQADEDDAHRSVRAGLELVARVGALRPAPDVTLRAKVGIATGLVVAGDTTGEGGIGMDTVVGDAPILAAGLQMLAESDQVIIGPRTYRLAGHAFTCADLGAHRLEGCSDEVRAWHVQGLKAYDSRFESAHAAPLAPIRGRDQEMALLLERWRQAQGGEGQVVLLEGEAGIGKSRIVRALAESLGDGRHFGLRFQCSPYHANTVLYPVINRLKRAARFAPEAPLHAKLQKLEALLRIARRPLEDDLPPIADLLSLSSSDRYPPLTGSVEQQRQQLLNALLAQLLGLARIRPVLLMLEDAHWLDPTTHELAKMVIEGAQDARLLLLITHRPDFQTRWNGYPHVTLLNLNRLTRQYSSAIVQDVAKGKALPVEVAEQILHKTDGVPLFIEELTRTILDSAVLKEHADHYHLTGPLPSLAIPDTLRDSLMARLDRLAPVKEVAQTAAAIGREFDLRFLQALSNQSDDILQQALSQLQNAGMVYRRRVTPEPTYAFKHALVQDTAYQSLLSRKRRQLHARITEIIQTEFPERLEAEPELMAHHATEAGLTETAIECWEMAGRRAVHRSANAEAAHHYTKAIELLTGFPDCAQRTRDELRLLLALGSVEMSRKGYAAPETERIYRRARELCGRLQNPPELAWVLQGVFLCHFMRGDLKSGREVAVEIHDLVRQSGDSACQVCAVVLLGDIELFSGSMIAGRARYEEALALYDHASHAALAELFGDDPAVVAAAQLGVANWLLGLPEQAIRRSDQALEMADRLSYVHTRAFPRVQRAWLHSLRREAAEALKWADASIALNTEHGFPDLLGWTTGVRGWALCHLGETEEGLAQLSQGIAIAQGTGAEIALSWFFAALSEGYAMAGNHEEALAAIDEAFAVAEKNGEGFWKPELHRLKGDLLRRLGAPDAEVEDCCTIAVELAASQQLKSLELRAAVSLAKLREAAHKEREARELVARVLGQFTEGFDTPDLVAARDLLDGLR